VIAMSRTSKKLIKKLSLLMDTTDDLCDVLTRYRTATAQLITLIESGGKMDESMSTLSSPINRRRELTETLDAFEAARHQARLAVFSLALDQGTSISGMARTLGVSRQLASRLAAEAKSGAR
jgi:hypothetical protein